MILVTFIVHFSMAERLKITSKTDHVQVDSALPNAYHN